MSALTATKKATRLFYVLDIEAFYFGRDYKIEFVGTYGECLAKRDNDWRYEVYDSLREFNAAVRYYQSIF